MSMSSAIQIRHINVEFLRPGPPHNQLLSPLTQYLAVCGDVGAGVITVPYEHARFERSLKDLRYEAGATTDHLSMLHDIGVDIGKMLGNVPGLPGSLTMEPSRAGTFVHLRLTFSASELALLPFELAKVPAGPNTVSDSWLALQTRPPVCLTRNIRTVSSESVLWPDSPRILFVAGGNPNAIPLQEHKAALLAAIKPFRYPRPPGRQGSDSVQTQSGHPKTIDATSSWREAYDDSLVVLVNPTLQDVVNECRLQRFTHVHVLAHGDVDESRQGCFGLLLRGVDGTPDVISGGRFAVAITSIGETQIHRPTVVTLASCDSGNVGNVVLSGASFAHAIHLSGVPFVVASQFPLSIDASIPLIKTLYTGMLWGEHPLLLVQKARAELHAVYTANWHDWASIVVYEALPQSLVQQLDTLRYRQSRRAINAALEHVDRAVCQTGDSALTEDELSLLKSEVDSATKRLPMAGEYGMECLGLRASARKRLAQATFKFAMRDGGVGKRSAQLEHFNLLESAWLDYEAAVRGLLTNESGAVQRLATPHWVLVQVESLSTVLMNSASPGRWHAAEVCAELYLDNTSTEQRAWARASLAELYVLRLAAKDLTAEQQQQCSDKAVEQAQKLKEIYPARTEFPVASTCRQFKRYKEWWCHSAFVRGLADRHNAGHAVYFERPIFLATVNKIIAILERTDNPGGAGDSSPPQGGACADASPDLNHSARSSPQKKGTRAGSTRAVKAALAGQPGFTVKREGRFFDIEMLPAGHGDCFWIEYGDGHDTHRVLIDCGTESTRQHLFARAQAVPEKDRRFELFVMTHIDADHIGAALAFMRVFDDGWTCGDVWFNGWQQLSPTLGARQGEMFSTAIQDRKLPWNQCCGGQALVTGVAGPPVFTLPGGMLLTILSPTPRQLQKLKPAWARELRKYGLEPGGRSSSLRLLRAKVPLSADIDTLAASEFKSDASLPNGSSIAFVAEYAGARVLFAADAHATVLLDSIKRLLHARGETQLELDALKLSHHGSRNNTHVDLLQCLACTKYLISTNGDRFGHPDPEAIARVIKYGGQRPHLFFNYKTAHTEIWSPDRRVDQGYAYDATYPNVDQPWLRISLLDS